jgi:crossover junction endodeoxyribonuclease RusA
MAELRIRVIGTPAPQGSKRHVGNGVLIEQSSRVRPWRQDVVAAAEKAAAECGWTAPREVRATLAFYFHRPKLHYRTGRNAHLLRENAPLYHAQKPDIDKLLRSTFDALKTAGVIRDDCQIADVHAAKFWIGPSRPAGASIVLSRATPPSEREIA